MPSFLLLAACGAPLARQGHHRAEAGSVPEPVAPARTSAPLRPPSAFAHLTDPTARGQALFTELAAVLASPRCANCHPTDDAPRQGDDSRPHEPPVVRGPADQGAPGLECTTCHPATNPALAAIPGAPGWHLAPRSMGWLGRTPAELCRALVDPAQNGGRTPDALVEHVSHDALVGWAWAPGGGRTPAPGTQAELGALARAWADAGAPCPEDP